MRFAPAAPEAAKDEALIRMVAYMVQLPRPFRSIDAGGVRMEFAVTGYQRPFLSSGARAMLAPWVAHRALPAVEAE